MRILLIKYDGQKMPHVYEKQIFLTENILNFGKCYYVKTTYQAYIALVMPFTLGKEARVSSNLSIHPSNHTLETHYELYVCNSERLLLMKLV